MKKSRRDYSKALAPALTADPFRDFEGSTAELYIAKFFYFLRSNLKKTILFMAAAAVIASGIAIWNVLEAEKAEKAVSEFEVLLRKNVISTETAEKEGAFRQLDAYLQKYNDRDSRNRVYLKKLEFLRNEKNYSEAAAVSAALAASVKPVYLKNYFRLMNAVYLEMAGRNEEALSAYNSLLTALNTVSFMKAATLFGKGRMLILTGKTEEGKEALRELLYMKEEEKGTEGLEDIRKAAAVFLISN